jgi:hypothetical protein
MIADMPNVHWKIQPILDDEPALDPTSFPENGLAPPEHDARRTTVLAQQLALHELSQTMEGGRGRLYGRDFLSAAGLLHHTLEDDGIHISPGEVVDFNTALSHQSGGSRQVFWMLASLASFFLQITPWKTRAEPSMSFVGISSQLAIL